MRDRDPREELGRGAAGYRVIFSLYLIISSMVQPSTQAMSTHKADVRDQVWSQLRLVALPDSRFHFDFSSFICDFQGSSLATALLVSHPSFLSSKDIFITPDNCLEELRLRALQAGKRVLVTTYGIRRGFWVLDPRVIGEGKWELAVMLDGMERFGRKVTLRELKEEKWDIGAMVTGTGAINREGVRFGKGHGFYDIEWAILFTLHLANSSTTTIAFLHSCQLLSQPLVPEIFDTVCDLIVTEKEIVEVEDAKRFKPTCGIVWDLLQEGMMEDIEPLKELKEILAEEEKRL